MYCKLPLCKFVVLVALLAWQPAESIRAVKRNIASISQDIASVSHSTPGECTQALRPILASVAVGKFFDAAMNWNYSFWEVWVSKNSAYKKQWGAAKKVPVFASSQVNQSLRWRDLMADSSVYTYERERLQVLGRLSQDDWYVVNESSVRGICDLSWRSLKFLINSKTFLEHAWLELPGESCMNTSLQELQVQARAALEKECTDECADTFSELFDKTTCKAIFGSKMNKTFQETFFAEAMNRSTQCADLPYDTVEKIADVTARMKCQTFHQPSFLWKTDYKSPGDVTQERFGGIAAQIATKGINMGASRGVRLLLGKNVDPIVNMAGKALVKMGNGMLKSVGKYESQQFPVTAVCTIPPELNRSGSKESIVQNGSCPEGMKCKCPMTELRDRQAPFEIRREGSVFFTEGIASVPSLAKQITGVGKIILTSSVKAALLSAVGFGSLRAISIPTLLLMQGARTAGQAFMAWATFECQSTVGCWPQEPDKVTVVGTYDACRMPAKAKEGGSPLWFLPPPGLRIKHSKRFCVLDECKVEDQRSQRVGLGLSTSDWREGKPDVYNCQPLPFEVMTTEQRTVFLEKLQESGIEDEYDLSDARAYVVANA